MLRIKFFVLFVLITLLSVPVWGQKLVQQSTTEIPDFSIPTERYQITYVNSTTSQSTSDNYYFLVMRHKTGESIDGSNPIANFGPGPSINDQGKVAFVAYESSSSRGRVFLDDNGNIERNYLVQELKGLSPSLQVNNSSQVLYHEYSTDGFFTYIPRLEYPTGQSYITSGSLFEQHMDTPFSSIHSYPSLNNNGMAVAGADVRAGGRILVAASSEAGTHYYSNNITYSPSLIPKLSDNNRTVTFVDTGSTDYMITFMDITYNSSAALVLANTPLFSAIGQRPAISDDGRVAVFRGNHTSIGSGIWVADLTSSSSIYVHLLESSLISNPNYNLPVGVNRTRSDNSNEYTVTYFQVTQTNRLQLCSRTIDVTNPGQLVPGARRLIVSTGDAIPGLGGVVNNMAFYDPINNHGQIVFWASTTSGEQSIVVARPPLHLSRIMPSGELEYFDLAKHAWNFSDGEPTIWPPTYYCNQFNYSTAIDPILNLPYTSNNPVFWNNTAAVSFPDWPVFVEAFGEGYCYNVVGYMTYYFVSHNPTALSKWKSIIPSNTNPYRGVCYGLATTCFQSFRDPAEYINNYQISDPILKDIHRGWLKQFGKAALSHENEAMKKRPNTTLLEMEEMFLNHSDDLKIMVYNVPVAGKRSKHAICPILLEKDPSDTDIVRIHAYDNNAWPIHGSPGIYEINTATNRWRCMGYPGITDAWKEFGLFLMDPIINYDGIVQLKGGNQSGDPQPKSNEYIQIYHPSDISVSVENSAGLKIGHNESEVFCDLDDGMAIVPCVGVPVTAFGLLLPPDTYTISTSDYPDNNSYISIETQYAFFEYQRNDENVEREDIIFNDGLTILNNEITPKNIDLSVTTVRDSIQWDVVIGDYDISTGANSEFRLDSLQRPELVHHGAPTNYNLSITVPDSTGALLFQHSGTEIQSNARHVVMAEFNSKGTITVALLIDNDLNGAFEDTLHLENISAVPEDPILPDDPNLVPSLIRSLQAYPNPFNPQTTIQYSIASPDNVSLSIFDISGRRVASLRNAYHAAGQFSIEWDGRDSFGKALASGTYFVQMQTSTRVSNTKLLLMK